MGGQPAAKGRSPRSATSADCYDEDGTIIGEYFAYLLLDFAVVDHARAARECRIVVLYLRTGRDVARSSLGALRGRFALRGTTRRPARRRSCRRSPGACSYRRSHRPRGWRPSTMAHSCDRSCISLASNVRRQRKSSPS